MARKTKTNKPLIKSNNNIINNLKLITNLLKGVHFDTYSSDYLSNSDSDKTRKSIDTSLDKLINTAYAQNTVSNLSKLYDQQSALDTNNIGLNMFEDPILSTNLVTTWMIQRWIQDQEDDINLVLKYMPKLKEAMTCKKDLVLSADHFSKDFCSFHKYNSDDTDGSLFARRIDEIKRVYNLAENFELWYEKAQNYGECFIYIAPYSEAFSKLLKNKSNTRFRGFNESTTLLEFNQDYIENNIINESELETVQKAFDEVGINSLTINFNEGLLLSEAKKLDAVRESGILKQESLYESFMAFQESTSIQEDSKYKLDKKLIPDDLEFDDKEDERYSSDGLVNLKQKAEDDVKIKVPGCIVKELERKNVIPLYIGDTCLGYYYIEIKTSELGVLDDPNAYNMSAGMVGYVTASLKNVKDTRVGDTITDADNPCSEPLPGYKKVNPMVYCGLYPMDGSDYENLKVALEKLKLNDAALEYEQETSAALGFGFRCGFLGMLHLEVIQERIEREFDLSIVFTSPSVRYTVHMKDGETLYIDNPLEYPDPMRVDWAEEPYIQANIITPTEYVGPIITLCLEKRGSQTQMNYLDTKRVELIYEMPLSEVLFDFYDRLKSISRGYASFDYNVIENRRTDLVRMEILVNGDPVDALSCLVYRGNAQTRGRQIVERLQGEIPRQQFKIAIQAAIGGQIIARETVNAYRKDVTAKCYGGDISRKRKLLEKQKEGKKRMKMVGNVEIPQSAFLAVLKTEEDK